MEITDIRLLTLRDELWKPWSIMVVDTDTDLRGIGEIASNVDAEAKQEHLETFKRWYIGENPLNIEKLRVQSMEKPWGLASLNQSLLSGLEIACWDIKGKHHGVPVHELLGGNVHESVEAYANRWYGGLEKPEEWADGAERVLSEGYEAIELNPFDTAFRNIDNNELDTVQAILEAIRDRVGSGPELLIEGHGRFSVTEAIKIGKRIEEYNPGWFEAPVLARTGYQTPAAYREVREAISIPIADDLVSARNKFSAFQFISERAIDVIQPDPILVGGLRETQYVGQMADAASIHVSLHASDGPVGACANVHVASVLPNLRLVEVDEFTQPDWVSDVIQTPIRVEDGNIRIPKRPGLGIDFDEEAAKEHMDNLKTVHNIHAGEFKDSFK
jgi:galactonate dehydratase